MKDTLKPRLSFLFFLQFFINGAIFPVIALYLKDSLQFTGGQAGLVMAMSSVTALVSPFLGAMVADKYISTERLFALSHLVSGILLLFLRFQTRFVPVLVLYFFFALFFGPTPALGNAIVFHHAPEGREKFGGIRLWGTLGWVTVALGFGLFWLGQGKPLGDALGLAGLVGLLQALFVFFFLPRGEKRAARRESLFPVQSLRLFLRKEIFLLSVVTLFFVTGEKIYYFGAGLYLRSLGLGENLVLPFMSLAQVGEVLALIMVGLMLPRWGSKRVMLLGLAFSVVKFGFLFAGGPLWAAGIGVAAHGPAFAFFLVTTFIYLDRQCSAEDRSGVHQIFSFLEAGVANFIGNVGSGLIMDRLTGPEGLVNFRIYWLFPAGGAVILFLMILFFLPSRERPAIQEYKAPPFSGDITDQL